MNRGDSRAQGGNSSCRQGAGRMEGGPPDKDDGKIREPASSRRGVGRRLVPLHLLSGPVPKVGPLLSIESHGPALRQVHLLWLGLFCKAVWGRQQCPRRSAGTAQGHGCHEIEVPTVAGHPASTFVRHAKLCVAQGAGNSAGRSRKQHPPCLGGAASSMTVSCMPLATG